MRSTHFYLLLSLLPLTSFADEPWCEQMPQEEVQCESILEEEAVCTESVPLEAPCAEPIPKWYFEVKPGYFRFTDSIMREFYGERAFTMRGEAGCKVWGPLIVWMDGGFLQGDGKAIGGSEKTKIMLATITVGLKLSYYFNDFFAVYGGAGPRIFMMRLHNESLFIRNTDESIGLGWGFDGGFWLFPFASFHNFSRNIFLDFFGDYSLKTLKTEPDKGSSEDFDVNVSGLSAGIGLGIRF